MTKSVTSKNFEQTVLKSSSPTVIKFFAQWCGACKQMKPIFEELSTELADKYHFVTADIEEDRELAVKYNVSSIPTFVFFKNGKEVGRAVGSMSKQDLISKIESFLK
jgi:thioredoxin 1